MVGDLAPYRRQYYYYRDYYKSKLAETNVEPLDIVTTREILGEMDRQLRHEPHLPLGFELQGSSPVQGPTLWVEWLTDVITKKNDVRARDYEGFLNKVEEYHAFWRKMNRPAFRISSFHDKQEGIRYLIKPNPLTLEIIDYIGDEFIGWLNFNVNLDSLLMRFDPYYGLLEMMKDRRDLAAAMRLSQRLPPDVEQSAAPINRSAWVEAASIIVGFIPVVGNAVAAYESYSGKDIFGYRLTPAERAILAGGVLLPFAARFVKGGKALYTASRTERLYGRSADDWTRALQKAEDAAQLPSSLRHLDEAERLVASGARLNARLAGEIEPLMKKMAEEVVSTRAPGVTRLAIDTMGSLGGRFKFLDDIDVVAMQRLLDKGPHVNHIKGQLLEELLETKIVQWLNKPFGKKALGLEEYTQKLEFFPGHMIRDLDGRQLTDGIIGHLDDQGVLQIVSIFEAKAGSRAARGLSSKSTSYNKLTKAEKQELRLVAREYHEELAERALKAGEPFNLTVEQVERKVILAERGGQVMQDIERLSQNADGALTDIFIGAEKQTVSVSSQRTKIFGVLPKDLAPGSMVKKIRNLGYNFDVMPIDVTQRDLIRFARKLAKEIETAAPAP